MFWRFHTAGQYMSDKFLVDIIDNPIKPLQEPFWWGDIPLPNPKPYFVCVAPEDKSLDVFWTASEFDIYHERVFHILKSLGVKFETFQTIFFDRTSKNQIDLPYKVFRPLEMYDALDSKLSIIESFTIGGIELPEYKKLVIKTNFHKFNRHFFRLSNHRPVEIVSDKLKTEFKKQDIEGFYFEDLS